MAFSIRTQAISVREFGSLCLVPVLKYLAELDDDS